MGARGAGGGQEEGPRRGRGEEERQAERQTSRIWGQKMRMQIKCHICFATTFKELSEVNKNKLCSMTCGRVPFKGTKKILI